MFNIGEKVQTQDGTVGVVADIFQSKQGQANLYSVEFCDESMMISMYAEDQLERYVPPRAWNEHLQLGDVTITAEMEENVVIMIIKVDDEEVARGHGHIIHEGCEGIIQAFSWAAKKAWNAVDEKTYVRSTYRLTDYRRF